MASRTSDQVYPVTEAEKDRARAGESRKLAVEAQIAAERVSDPMATPEASGSGEKVEGSEPSVTYYRLEEVAKRNTAEETWMVIHGRVYDITRFLSEVRAWEAGGLRAGWGWGLGERPRVAVRCPEGTVTFGGTAVSASSDNVRFSVHGALAGC